MMTRELIDSLSKFDLDTPVVIRGYEGGYKDNHDPLPRYTFQLCSLPLELQPYC